MDMVGATPSFTIRLKVVVWLTNPAVAVTIIAEVATGVETLVVIVRVVVQVGVQDVGENTADDPAGNPEAVYATDVVEPDVRVEVIVLVAVKP